ncbi:MAG: beta strand repeat-containing protein [Candidatus Xenobiia bacterium LiM19]
MHGWKKNSVFLIVLCVAALLLPGCGGGGSSDSGWYSSGDSGGSSTTSSPTITSCSLSSQQFTPGSVCTVQGTAFGDTRSTRDGGSSQIYLYYNSGSSYIVVPSANIVSWSATSITFIIPSTVSAGTAYVIAINRVVSGTTYSSGATSSSTNTITPSSPVNAPVISSISPSSNITAGSTSITIYGSNFGSTQASGSYVGFTLNGVITAALSVTSWSSNYIVLVVPASTPAGSVSAYVQTATGGSSNNYTISVSSSSSAPSISSITSASPSQGSSITISGTNFGSSSSSSYVMIGSVQASVTSWSDNTIVCVVPTSVSPGSRNVTVTTSAGTSSAYVITVTAMTGAPSISSITPTTVNQTANISISGLNFGTRDSKDTSYVMIGSVSGTIVSWTNTLIVVTITTSTTQGSNDVYVSVGGVSSNTSTITIVSSTAPTISSLSPSSVTQGAGTALTIYGTNFGSAGATSYVTIGGYTATITSWGANTIVVTVPTSVGAGSATVYVIVAGTSTNSYALTVSSTTTPVISGITTPAAHGQTVTISGSNFGSTAGTVSFGGVAQTVFGSWGTSGITCTVPYATAIGSVNVTVTNSSGYTSSASAITVTAAWGTADILSDNTTPGAATFAFGGLIGVKVVTLSNGNVLAIYRDKLAADVDESLYAKVWNGAWTAAPGQKLNFATGADVNGFDVAAAPSGAKAMIVWQQNDGVNEQIYFAAYDTGVWDTPANAADNLITTAAANQPTANTGNPKLAYDKDAKVVVVWAKTNASIWASRSVDNGATLPWGGAPVNIVEAGAITTVKTPVIGFVTGTTIGYAVWIQDIGADDRVIARQVDSSNAGWTVGTAWGAGTTPLDTAGGVATDDASNPQVVFNTTAGMVVFEKLDTGVANHIYAAKYTHPGAWTTPPQQVDTTDLVVGTAGLTVPQVTLLSTGVAVVVYSDNDDSLVGGKILARYCSALGVWSLTLDEVQSTVSNKAWIPVIAADASGNASCVYVQQNAGATLNRTFSSFYNGTSWTRPSSETQAIDGNTGKTVDNTVLPSVTYSSTSAYALFVQQNSSGFNRVYWNRYY